MKHNETTGRSKYEFSEYNEDMNNSDSDMFKHIAATLKKALVDILSSDPALLHNLDLDNIVMEFNNKSISDPFSNNELDTVGKGGFLFLIKKAFKDCFKALLSSTFTCGAWTPPCRPTSRPSSPPT